MSREITPSEKDQEFGKVSLTDKNLLEAEIITLLIGDTYNQEGRHQVPERQRIFMCTYMNVYINENKCECFSFKFNYVDWDK